MIKNCSAAFLCQDVISLLTNSIQTCAVLFGLNPCNKKEIIIPETPRIDKKNKNKDDFNEADSNLSLLKIIPSANTEYDNTLFEFRGLYPMFSFKEETPNGINGKEATRKIATLVVEGMIEYISRNIFDFLNDQKRVDSDLNLNKYSLQLQNYFFLLDRKLRNCK